ncbi:phasin family protein [bacterium M00.F.Ca.ET.228.01.1.1]|uniref:phasin family protein n=1 Tax=Paraburkholderia phenoliruptrix TaxID=252970 RepID=UPI001092FF2F|nr:phasin family protein [Paraburkholderia phenoliruptrix]TGP46036.1 phasin family protein [bacterium M00.F.Ca.ET.228.01.1.1]TGS04051.1 phasin family protein [bacterium M00.F.Ca.ET.191.01.1.1]TGU07329.1 phasin family protein [bacterium M00.F.Ca.ET.155.01.1.1]MBW0446571.1 phasin family protein [Paraburkholderia phenoliruptrix]MBW9097002.1 phasin family protein [Paraburkholderia phenoliruptrix]
MNAIVLNQPDVPQQSHPIAAYEFAAKAVAGLEKVVELNVQTVKTSLSEQQALVDAALSAASMDQIIDLQFQQVPAAVKKTCAYWGHVEDIAVDMHNDFTSVVQDSLQGYLSNLFSFLDSAASFGMASSDRTNITSPLAIEQPPAPRNEPVVIVDSSGNVVSSSPRTDLH